MGSLPVWRNHKARAWESGVERSLGSELGSLKGSGHLSPSSARADPPLSGRDDVLAFDRIRAHIRQFHGT